MKVQKYIFPKSSFLSIDKDTNIILDKLLNNQVLLKLLKYPCEGIASFNPLEQPNLTEDEAWEMVGGDGKQIKIVPKVQVDPNVKIYIIISFDNFTPNIKNPYYRDNIISFDIICHFSEWQLSGKYTTLRPYCIAGQIDSMLNGAKLTGIGTINFLGANQLILNDEFAGLSLMYSAIHGDDDTNPKAKGPDGEDIINPNMADLLINNFNEMYN